MLTVSHDFVAVELLLSSRGLMCPVCRGRLRPWGFGRERTVRVGVPAINSRLTPRRGRCVVCGATHVLLPGLFAARRADAAAVIGQGIELSVVGGLGHRKIAFVSGPVNLASARTRYEAFLASLRRKKLECSEDFPF